MKSKCTCTAARASARRSRHTPHAAAHHARHRVRPRTRQECVAAVATLAMHAQTHMHAQAPERSTREPERVC